MQKIFVILLLPLLLSSFLLVGCSFAQIDTSVLTMSGKDWSIKVDSTLQTSLDSKSLPYTSVAKAGAEKELFLTLNSLKDCVAGQIEFKVSTQGLSVYKQLPLDKELNVSDYDFVNATVAMRKEQVVVSRPENVVNSFACFDESGKKVLHIYASKLIDTKGNSIWVDSDLKDGLLTVYLDQKWLAIAVFPVLLDPSFGYTAVGGSTGGYDGRVYVTAKFTVTDEIVVNSVCVFSRLNQLTRVGIYNDTAGAASSKVYGSGELQSPAGYWIYDYPSDLRLVSGSYWLAFSSNNATGGNGFAFDTLTNGTDYMWSAWGDLPATFTPTGLSARIYSIYLNYTLYVAPTPTPSPSPSPSPTPVLEGDLSDTQWFAGALIFILVIFNIVLFMLPFALMRFVFAVVSLALCALAFAYAVPFSPYLQLLGCLVSVLSMYFASRARE